AYDGFQRSDRFVVVLRQVLDDMVVIDGEAMTCVDGCRRAPDQDGAGQLGLQERGMREQVLPIRSLRCLSHGPSRGTVVSAGYRARASRTRAPSGRPCPKPVQPPARAAPIVRAYRRELRAPGLARRRDLPVR